MRKQIKTILWNEKIPIFIYLLLLGKVILFHIFTNIVITQGAILTSVGLLTVLLGFSFLFQRQGKLIFLFIVNFLVSLLLLSNVLYYSYFGSPFTVYVFQQIQNLSGLSGSIWYLFKPAYVFFIFDLFLFLWFILKKRDKADKNISLAWIVIAIGLLITFVKPIKVLFLDQTKDPFRTFDSTDLVKGYGIFGHHIIDTANAIIDRNYELTEDEREELENWFENKNNGIDSWEDTPYFSFGKGKNLIVIQVESLQNFVINKKIYGQEITPNINRMLEHSIYFPQMYPQTIEGNSSDAELLSQASIYPIDKGATFFRFRNNEFITLGDRLKEQGYSTLAIHADEATFWNRNQVYPNFGFDKFYSIEHFKLDEIIGMGLGDRSMFRQSIKWLKEQKKPFYSFFITLTNHVPFIIPENERKLRLTNDLNGTNLGHYFQSVRYTDEAIGILLNELDKHQLLEDTVIALYGDHNGIFLKDKHEVEEKWVGQSISDEQWVNEYMNIPFIIYHPNLKGITETIISGQIDIMPTLSHIMGLEKEAVYYTMGENLISNRRMDREVIIPSGDYNEKGMYFTDGQMKSNLDKKQWNILNISEKILKSNYYKNK